MVENVALSVFFKYFGFEASLYQCPISMSVLYAVQTPSVAEKVAKRSSLKPMSPPAVETVGSSACVNST
jgi:hypothetical protein